MSTATSSRAVMTMPSPGLRRRPRVWFRELGGAVLAIAITIAIWQIAFLVVPANTYLVSPLAAVVSLGHNFGTLMLALAQTCLMVVLGYCIAVVVAFIAASLTISSLFAARAILPLALVIGSVPTIVITPVLLLLLGRGVVTTIAVCTIVTFFQCFVSLTAGMRAVPRDLVDYVRVSGGRRLVELLTVRIPSSTPAIISASKLALPAALSGVILAEVIATGTGVGNYINTAKANFEYAEMWAGIVMTLIVSVLAYAALAAWERILIDKFAPDTDPDSSFL